MSTLPFGIVLLLALLVSAVVSFAATPLVKRMAYKLGAIDVPKDNRRMHKEPIPRMGGLAIAISFILTVLIFGELDRQMRGILLGAVIIVVLGVLDDCLTLRALFKFLVQRCCLRGGCPWVYHSVFVQSGIHQRCALFGFGELVCAHYHHLDCSHHQCGELH